MAGTICFLSVLKLSADNFTFAVPVPLMTTLTRASFCSGSGYIWIYLNIIEICFRSRLQTDASYNAVPVSLGLVGYAVRIRSDIDFFDTIIHPDGDSTFSGTDIMGYIILMGNTKTILHSCLLSVHPYGCFYMGTFQEQQNTFTFPVGRYIHLFLIPSSSYIMFVGRLKDRKNGNLILPSLRYFSMYGL